MNANSLLSMGMGFGSFFWAFLPIAALAQSGGVQQAPPPPPWVAEVPENAQWTVSIGRADATSASPSSMAVSSSQPSQLHVIKTASTKHDEVTYKDGKKEEYWYMGHVAFLTDSGDKNKIAIGEFSSFDATGAGDPLMSLGFTGVGWVNGAHFDAKVTYQNVECYHYRLKGSVPVEAWIRVKDKVPVAYQIADLLYVYSFGPAPTEPLALPPVYQTAWNQHQLVLKRQEMYQKDLGKH